MKKLLLFLLTLMLGFSTLQVSAQETLTVHDGTATNSYVPVYGFYADAYLKAEFVISANDLTNMTGGSISGMKFYASQSSVSWGNANFQVFLTEVNNESISDFEGTGNATIVYTGPLSIANGEMEITFSTEYTYSGGNLLVGIYNTVIGTYVSSSWYGETVNGASVQGYSYSDLASVSPTQRNFIPKTTFTYTSSGTNCFSPNYPLISDISAYEATLSWTPREGQTAWEVCCVSGVFDPDQASWTPVTDTFYTFTGLTPATGYTAYVRTNCGSEVSNYRQVNFTTETTCPSIPSNVTVSNITATTVDVNWTAGIDDSAWEVVVVPSNAAPETGIPEQTTDHPYTVSNLQDNTQYKVYVRTDCGGGDHSYWSTGTSFTTHPFCSSPLSVTISQITATSALVSWQPATYGATSYTVEYSLTSEENWTMELVDGTQYMISNLEPDSTYNVMVYSNCDLGTADTVHENFTTKHCLVGGDLQIGEGTSTTSYYPTNSCYNYSYTQQIFLASEMNGAANINSIAVDVYSIASNSRQISIYLMHTTAASGDLLPTTNAQLVYSGTFNPVIGWNTFNFTTPFQYNGTSNLALIIIDATGSYNCSNYYNCHTASATLSHCEYQDNTPYSINNIPSGGYSDISSTRCNVIFGIDCDNNITCVRPNVYVTETSENSVTLDWAPGYTESSWEVEYSDNDSVWTPAGTTNTHPYEVTGLNANTKYYFQVRSDCGAEQSDWSAVTDRTACGALTQLPYSEDFEDASTIYNTTQDNYILCWDRYASDPAHYVYIPSNSYAHSGTHFLDFHHTNSCFNIAIMPELDVTFNASDLMVSFYACRSGNTGSLEVGVMTDKEDPTTFETVSIIDLSAANTYEYVEQHISLEDYTGSGTFIAFRVSNAQSCGFYIDDVTLEERPNCMYPASVTVSNVGNDNLTLSWIAMGTATAWNIEYATSDFTPGEGYGTLINSVTDNPYTIENLIPATTYYIYMQSDCGSAWVGPVTATPGQYIMGTTGSDTLTTCGVIIYDDGGPDGDYSTSCNFTLILYPENPNAMLFLSGTSNTEGNNYDYLRVYDGAGTSGTELAYYNGSNQIVNVMSQSGPLTLVFHSDGTVVYPGFAITATCVTCYPPTNVTTSNPTLDGATVSWSGTGDSYVLFLNGDMTTGYPANDTTYTFSGLTSSTLYSVRVASICNGDTSMLSSAATFATACDAITITVDNPWTEDFENYQGSGVQQFVCWDRPVTEVVDNGTAPFVYCGYGQAAHSGANSAEMKGNINMLALPAFTNDLSELRISFWATGYSYTNTNVEVGYMTDINDTSTFVSVANAGTPGARGGSNGGNGNYMGPFSFGNVTVSNARIALRYTGPGSSSGWNVDDFIVEIAPDCESPVKTSVTATNIGGHVATISWVDNDDTHSSWTVYYRETSAGNDDPWDYVSATDTFVTITGLDPVTSYDVYVITNCGTPEANPDATHTISFMTAVACPAPTDFAIDNISSDEATITWNGTASSYNVEYGEAGFTPGTGTVDVAYSESFTMSNLTSNTSYTIYVNSDCSDANDSLSTTVSFTFRTTQVPADLPYTADFTVANEWVLNNGSCANYWTTGTVHSTPSLFVTNNGTTPGYATGSNSVVTAEKLLTVGDNASVNINFDVYVGGEASSSYAYDYLKVFFAPAETDYPSNSTYTVPDYATAAYETNAVDFQNYLSQTDNSYNPYKLNLTNDTLHVAVEMPNPNANPTSTSTAKLVFVWRNDGSSGTMPGAIISNVTVAVNSCPMPSNLTVDNITINSADISWTSGNEVSAWILEYQAAGDSTWTIENIATTPEYTLNNLTTATTYTVRVKSDCASEESGYQIITFTTSCGTVTALPYTENFDNISSDDESAFPTCWARPVQYLGYPFAVTAQSHSNPASLRFQALTTSPTTAVTPQFAEDVHNLSLNFWLKAESTTYSGTFEVGVMTDPNNTATFVGVWTIQPTSTNWTEYTLNFDTTSVSGANKYIAFRQHSNSSSWYYWLDDVTIDLNGGTTPTDPTVTTDAATAITQTTATLNGVVNNPDNVTITARGFEWKAASASTYTVVNLTGTANTLTHNLTGLTANTAYTYKAFITFNGNTVYGADMPFTTLEEGQQTCNVPTNLTATATAYNTANVTWTAGGSETAWNLQYKAASATNWSSSIAVTATNYQLTGLTAETAYQVRVQAVCSNTSSSDWATASFTTPAEPVDPCDAPTNLQVSNITHNSATATWTPGGNETAWNIQYKLQSASQWQEANVQTPSYDIEGLTANSTYDVRVKAICAADNQSDFVTATFTTLVDAINDVTLAQNINLMPNPADNYIELSINSNVEVKEAIVYNAFGQMIQTVQLTENHARIDLSNMAAGMYFVRVNGEGVTATKKFIKK